MVRGDGVVEVEGIAEDNEGVADEEVGNVLGEEGVDA